MMVAERPIRVLCVDDLPDNTAVMRLLVESESDMQCAGELHSADDLIEQALSRSAAIILLDATMPGRDPLQAMREVSEAFPPGSESGVKVIIYSGHDSPEFIDQVIESGGWGLISKHDPPERLAESIREVANGGTCLPASIKKD